MLTENSCRLARRATVFSYAFEGREKLVKMGLPSIRAVTDMRAASSSSWLASRENSASLVHGLKHF